MHHDTTIPDPIEISKRCKLSRPMQRAIIAASFRGDCFRLADELHPATARALETRGIALSGFLTFWGIYVRICLLGLRYASFKKGDRVAYIATETFLKDGETEGTRIEVFPGTVSRDTHDAGCVPVYLDRDEDGRLSHIRSDCCEAMFELVDDEEPGGSEEGSEEEPGASRLGRPLLVGTDEERAIARDRQILDTTIRLSIDLAQRINEEIDEQERAVAEYKQKLVELCEEVERDRQIFLSHAPGGLGWPAPEWQLHRIGEEPDRSRPAFTVRAASRAHAYAKLCLSLDAVKLPDGLTFSPVAEELPGELADPDDEAIDRLLADASPRDLFWSSIPTNPALCRLRDLHLSMELPACR